MNDQTSTILIVDDEVDVAESFASMLSDRYDTRTAYGGREALEKLDDDVDIVLLDRRMPKMTGDQVLEKIQELPNSVFVAMVTAVEPDIDILDLGFDDYVTKPVSRDELFNMIEMILARSTYESEIQEYFALVTKKATLEAKMGEAELEDSQEYQDLRKEIDMLASEIDEIVEDLSLDDYKAVLRDIQRAK